MSNGTYGRIFCLGYPPFNGQIAKPWFEMLQNFEILKLDETLRGNKWVPAEQATIEKMTLGAGREPPTDHTENTNTNRKGCQ